MKGETADRWRKLCEQAAVEQDSDRLIELAKEINRLLEEKEERLKNLRKPRISPNNISAYTLLRVNLRC